MKPRLVLGLGGAFAGDDAVGLELARRLAAHARLPHDVEAVQGGPDLLRLGAMLAGRRHVVLVDAVQARPDDSAPLVGDHPLAGLDDRQTHAHHLSAVQALELLLLSEPGLARTRFTWFLVPVSSSEPGDSLSPELSARLPGLVEEILALL